MRAEELRQVEVFSRKGACQLHEKLRPSLKTSDQKAFWEFMRTSHTSFPGNNIGIAAMTEGYSPTKTPCTRLGTNAERNDLSVKRSPGKLISFFSHSEEALLNVPCR